MKSITISIIILLILSLFLVPDVHSQWSNICAKNSDTYYCKNINKHAYNMQGPSILKNIDLGKIIGVAWRPKGSLIGVSIAIPEAGLPEEIRTSPRNAYYYIIDDGGEKPFIRQCREIEAR